MREIRHPHSANAPGPAEGTAKLTPGRGLAAEEKNYFPYVACALGLAEQLSIRTTSITGGSTVLESDEVGPLVDTILDWCPAQPSGL